jgi:SH3-like domain-containing protein
MSGRFGRTSLQFVAICFAATAFVSAGPLAHAETWRVNGLAPDARLHIREAANVDADVLGYVPGNARGLRSRACAGNWCEIEYNGIRGWVYKLYLLPDNLNAEAPQAEPKAAVTAGSPGADIEALVREKTIPLTPGDGRPRPVYAFPDQNLPVAGLLPADTAQVDGLGTCMRSWCYVRSGPLIGWMPVTAFDLSARAAPADVTAAIHSSPSGDAKPAPVPEAPSGPATRAPPADDGKTLNKTETTALSGAIAGKVAPVAKIANGEDGKLYALAGLAGDSALPIYDKPDGNSPILAWIPKDARDIEGMKKCQDRWCLVRWQAATGWVARRHLVDEVATGSQTFQVTGLPLWSPLKVVDEPAEEANEVGTIPSYATGIVPIGVCNQYWCHVRYLGIAGWVSARHLQPQAP